MIAQTETSKNPAGASNLNVNVLATAEKNYSDAKAQKAHPQLLNDLAFQISDECQKRAIEARKAGDTKQASEMLDKCADYRIEGMQFGLSDALANRNRVGFLLNEAVDMQPSADRQRELFAVINLTNAMTWRGHPPEQAIPNIGRLVKTAAIEYELAANSALLSGNTERYQKLKAYGEKLKVLKEGEIILPWDAERLAPLERKSPFPPSADQIALAYRKELGGGGR